MTSRFKFVAILVAALATQGCSSIYYSALETIGKSKRDLLVSRVKSGREDQEDAKEQIQTTFEKFKELTNYDGGDLEKTYNKLSKELERSDARATNLKERVDSIQDVGNALFREWEGELDDFKRDDLRRASQQKLDAARRKFDTLIGAMEGVENRITPVLDAFRDQVLFLKHNLNAQAVASLDGTLGSLQSDVSSLIAEMDRSIAEADTFLATLEK